MKILICKKCNECYIEGKEKITECDYCKSGQFSVKDITEDEIERYLKQYPYRFLSFIKHEH